jgi:tetratricopeptide (TPR) repeat protein
LVKKACFPIILSIILGACVVTYAPLPPNLYIENLPQSMTTSLSLDERIQLEEAWELLREGWIDKAEKAFLRLGPESPFYSTGLGYIAMARENFPAAEQNLVQALNDHPHFLLARLGLAQVFQKTGEQEKAFSELREVLNTNPENSWARKEYEQIKASMTDQAIEEARQAQGAGEAERAKQAYLRALQYSPESAKVHLALADIYKKENKISSVLVHLSAAAASDPENIKILADLAQTLAEAKEYERSLEVYEKILEIDQGNRSAKEQVESLKNKLGIYELPSRYNEIPLTETVTREDVAALLAVKLGDLLGEPGSQPPIMVDISASWAAKFILKVASLRLLEVYANHTFQPRKNLSRGDLAETLFRTVRYLEQNGHRFIRQIPPGQIQIADVPTDQYNYQPISQILSYQIMELYPDRTFRPNLTVPGQEAVRAIDILLALVR